MLAWSRRLEMEMGDIGDLHNKAEYILAFMAGGNRRDGKLYKGAVCILT